MHTIINFIPSEEMIGFIDLVDGEIKIQENFEKLRQKRCDSHNKYKASHFCTNISCITNSTGFLCELCYNNHSKDHPNHKEIKSVDDLFSMKRLTQIKEDCRIDTVYEEKINAISQDLDQIFGKLKKTFNEIIDEECEKAKSHIKQKYVVNNEYIMKIVKEHEQILRDLFTKDEIMNNFEFTINPYLISFNKISDAFLTQIEIVENLDKNIALHLNNFSKITEKHKLLVDSLRNQIANFDGLHDNLKLEKPIQSVKLNEIFTKKLQTGVISNKVKKIPRLHTDSIWKIINYKNNTKYITCSRDETIIIRNCEDNKLIKTLIGHEKPVRDILLLSDGRLASSSQDKTIKIWNLTNGKCEQTLIGHSFYVYCLLELPNSILLSGSSDSSIGVWDISGKYQKELEFHHQVKNDEQKQVYCMTLINSNELAVAS